MFTNEESILDKDYIRDYYQIDSDAHLAYIEESNKYLDKNKYFPIYYYHEINQYTGFQEWKSIYNQEQLYNEK